MRHLLPVSYLANGREKVNEDAGRVKLPVEFTRRVVVREHMVVIMVALTDRPEGDKEVLNWVDVLIVRLVAPQVCHAVDAPGDMQGEGVAQHPRNVEGRPSGLTPEVPWHDGREDEACREHQPDVEPITRTSKVITINYHN